MYTRIVVPLDGSDIAEQALPHAEQLAGITGLPLHLIRVVDIAITVGTAMVGISGSDDLFIRMLQNDEATAGTYLADLKARYAGRNIRVTTERRTGAAAQELLSAARGGDIYVMASHGRGGISRWFLGSVVEEVSRHARIPVMVIRAQPAQQAHPASGPVLIAHADPFGSPTLSHV